MEWITQLSSPGMIQSSLKLHCGAGNEIRSRDKKNHGKIIRCSKGQH